MGLGLKGGAAGGSCSQVLPRKRMRKGRLELAKKVVDLCAFPGDFRMLYSLDELLMTKVE